jgi:hypothetical protein
MAHDGLIIPRVVVVFFTQLFIARIIFWSYTSILWLGVFFAEFYRTMENRVQLWCTMRENGPITTWLGKKYLLMNAATHT